MTQGTIANGESGLSVRTKINSNFLELYGDEGLVGNRTVRGIIPQNYYGTGLSNPNMALSTVGSQNNGTLANTNERTRRRRVTYSTGATPNTSGGFRSTGALGYRGDASGRGGFVARFRFALNTVPSGYRAFVGLLTIATAPSGSVDPSSLTDMIGLGKDAADTAWTLMHNDASGSAVKETVSGIPITANAVIELTLTCAPGSSPNISYEVKEVTGIDSDGNDTYGTPVTGTISSELPVTLTGLFEHLYINTGAGSSDARIDLLRYNGVTLGD